MWPKFWKYQKIVYKKYTECVLLVHETGARRREGQRTVKGRTLLHRNRIPTESRLLVAAVCLRVCERERKTGRVVQSLNRNSPNR